jgi:CRISPR-associated protein Cas1
MKPQIRPKQILLSQRANVFYLEHAKLVQKDEKVVYLVADQRGVETFFNIPERNTAFILLGKGTSITDAAARKLAESNVVVGFVGNGGTPLISTVDMAFLTPQSEYRPTEYMQAWVKKWCDDAQRLAIAKALFVERINWTTEAWKKSDYAELKQIEISEPVRNRIFEKIKEAEDTAHLMAVEAEWARYVYRTVANAFSLSEFTRVEGMKRSGNAVEEVNGLIDHGNYIAYGYAAAALNVLGISFAFPVMHGKTRRGALVFDIADLYKDALVLPLAFYAATHGYRNQEFRDALIDSCLSTGLMDRVLDTIIYHAS